MLTEYISSGNTTKLLTSEESNEIKTEEGMVEKE